MRLPFPKTASVLSGLLIASLPLQLSAANVGPPPDPYTPPNAMVNPPCGNPFVSDQPECPGCDSDNSDLYENPVGSSCDSNSINSYNGDAHRKITDLDIAGSVGNKPLRFTRFSNTRLSARNLAGSSFGIESPWSHNFEWLMRDNGGTPERPIITVTYPEGKERSFWLKTGSTTEWVKTTPHKNPDRIISSGDDPSTSAPATPVRFPASDTRSPAPPMPP